MADYRRISRKKSKPTHRSDRPHDLPPRARARDAPTSPARCSWRCFAILLTTTLIRLLGQAAGGNGRSEAVLALLGFGAINLSAHHPVADAVHHRAADAVAQLPRFGDDRLVRRGAAAHRVGRPGDAVRRCPSSCVIAVLSLLLSPWALSKSAEYRQAHRASARKCRRSRPARSANRRRAPGVLRRGHRRRRACGEEHLRQLDPARARSASWCRREGTQRDAWPTATASPCCSRGAATRGRPARPNTA
ncbi:MAG: hypothetical protein MZV65_48400 [Chromatiales bacterium]|nr:hypothetical protein [Chromatiales bacterium]